MLGARSWGWKDGGGDDDKHFSPVYLRPDGNETDPLPLPGLVIVLLAL